MTSSDRLDGVKNCADYEADFGALLSGEATREEMRRANEHLAACPECARMFGSLAVFKKRIGEAYGRPEIERAGAGLRRKMAYLAVAASLAVGFAVYPQLAQKQEITAVVEPEAGVLMANLAMAETAAVTPGEEELVLTDEEAAAMMELVSDAELDVYFGSNG